MTRRIDIIGRELNADDMKGKLNSGLASPSKAEDLADTDEVGEDTIAALQSSRKEVMSKSERAGLWSCLSGITRPRWHDTPPPQLGSTNHGKLKAAQFRSLSEFDLVVALTELWTNSTNGAKLLTKDQELKLKATISLFTALRFATSETTSAFHARQYQHYLKEYLDILLDGGWKLRPNHHAALHVGDMLLRFGPVRGWWMFPFERVIGRLQRMNTNSIIGESKESMEE